MDAIKGLMATSKLKTSYLEGIVDKGQNLFLRFDKDADILILLLTSPEHETVVHYMDKNVAILYKPDDLEIVGLQVEGFETQFVPMYSALKKSWSIRDTEIKPGNLWDFSLAVQEREIEVALELTKVIQPIVGSPAEELERAIETVYC